MINMIMHHIIPECTLNQEAMSSQAYYISISRSYSADPIQPASFMHKTNDMYAK
jgi:hypothetical protein